MATKKDTRDTKLLAKALVKREAAKRGAKGALEAVKRAHTVGDLAKAKQKVRDIANELSSPVEVIKEQLEGIDREFPGSMGTGPVSTLPEYFVCEEGPMGGIHIIFVGASLEQAEKYVDYFRKGASIYKKVM
jgi:hypothetical protein